MLVLIIYVLKHYLFNYHSFVEISRIILVICQKEFFLYLSNLLNKKQFQINIIQINKNEKH